MAAATSRRCAGAGLEPPARVPLPGPLPLAHGQRVLAVMYVADFLTQFHKLLGVRPLTYADLDRLADHGCGHSCRLSIIP